MLCCFAGIDHMNNCIWYLVILALVLPPLRLLHICCPHPVLCVLLVQLMSGAVFFLLSKISGHTGTRTASRSCVLI